jgi:hypothetical protein
MDVPIAFQEARSVEVILRDVYQTNWIDSNACFPHLTAARARLGVSVQTKGLGSAFVSATKRLMAAFSLSTDTNTPRLRRRRVSLAKKLSTALSLDAEVGVKWKV